MGFSFVGRIRARFWVCLGAAEGIYNDLLHFRNCSPAYCIIMRFNPAPKRIFEWLRPIPPVPPKSPEESRESLTGALQKLVFDKPATFTLELSQWKFLPGTFTLELSHWKFLISQCNLHRVTSSAASSGSPQQCNLHSVTSCVRLLLVDPKHC